VTEVFYHREFLAGQEADTAGRASDQKTLQEVMSFTLISLSLPFQMDMSLTHSILHAGNAPKGVGSDLNQTPKTVTVIGRWILGVNWEKENLQEPTTGTL
jgi:hypothetical protein